MVTISDDGNTICIATFRDQDLPTGHGDCYTRVYRFDGNDQIQLESDIEFMPAVWDPEYFSTISGDGNTVAVISIDAATVQGTVKVYTYNGDIWNQQGSTLNLDTKYGGRWNSVSLSDDGTVLAFGENKGGGSLTKVKLFRYQDNDRFHRGHTIIISENARFWAPVSLSASDESVFVEGTGPIEVYDCFIAPSTTPTISATPTMAPTARSMPLALAFANVLDRINAFICKISVIALKQCLTVFNL